MYHFAVLALLALATVKVVDFLCDNVPGLDSFRSLLTFIGGIGAVLMLDYSAFAGWGIDVRNADVAVWMTGFMVTGLTIPWRAAFAYLTHDKATGDETLGQHTPLRRAA